MNDFEYLEDQEKKQLEIRQYLIEQYGFEPSGYKDMIILKVHIIHRLFYSHLYKCFTLAILNDRHKGGPAGTYSPFIQEVDIPKIIYSKEDADLVMQIFKK